jgi:formate dehydrogenase subunit delta
VTEDKIKKLVRMANQIGDFYAAMPDNEAAAGAATHFRRFWTPKMIGELVAFAEAGRADLNATAARAVEALKSAGRA